MRGVEGQEENRGVEGQELPEDFRAFGDKGVIRLRRVKVCLALNRGRSHFDFATSVFGKSGHCFNK